MVRSFLFYSLVCKYIFPKKTHLLVAPFSPHPKNKQPKPPQLPPPKKYHPNPQPVSPNSDPSRGLPWEISIEEKNSPPTFGSPPISRRNHDGLSGKLRGVVGDRWWVSSVCYQRRRWFMGREVSQEKIPWCFFGGWDTLTFVGFVQLAWIFVVRVYHHPNGSLASLEWWQRLPGKWKQ